MRRVSMCQPRAVRYMKGSSSYMWGDPAAVACTVPSMRRHGPARLSTCPMASGWVAEVARLSATMMVPFGRRTAVGLVGALVPNG